MDPTDLEIQRRLEKLKERESNQIIPSEDELHRRLRDLKGLPPTTATSNIRNKYVLFPKLKSDQEQIDDLMQQFSEEVNLNVGSSTSTVSVDETEKRLQNLKSQNDAPVSSNINYTQRESDTKILLKKILAEAELEKKTENKFPNLIKKPDETKQQDEHMDLSNSEDEFCSICEKYPKWICLNCDKDVFCTRCFKEFHDDLGECHQRKPFVRQRKPSSDSDYSD